jgi:hypothetical protein
LAGLGCGQRTELAQAGSFGREVFFPDGSPAGSKMSSEPDLRTDGFQLLAPRPFTPLPVAARPGFPLVSCEYQQPVQLAIQEHVEDQRKFRGALLGVGLGFGRAVKFRR